MKKKKKKSWCNALFDSYISSEFHLRITHNASRHLTGLFLHSFAILFRFWFVLVQKMYETMLRLMILVNCIKNLLPHSNGDFLRKKKPSFFSYSFEMTKPNGVESQKWLSPIRTWIQSQTKWIKQNKVHKHSNGIL